MILLCVDVPQEFPSVVEGVMMPCTLVARIGVAPSLGGNDTLDGNMLDQAHVGGDGVPPGCIPARFAAKRCKRHPKYSDGRGAYAQLMTDCFHTRSLTTSHSYGPPPLASCPTRRRCTSKSGTILKQIFRGCGSGGCKRNKG